MRVWGLWQAAKQRAADTVLSLGAADSSTKAAVATRGRPTFPEWLWFLHDDRVLPAIHILLITFTILAFFRDRGKTTGVVAIVNRGTDSMAALYTGYALLALVLVTIVVETDAFAGYRGAVVVGDYLLVTYLFFFNNWFRNSWIGLTSRLRKETR